MSWLSDRLGIHVNLRPLAPIIGATVGSVIPGVGTAAGAGLGSFLDGLGNGDGLQKSAIHGGLAYGGGKALGALQHAFAPGSVAGASIGTAVGQGVPEAGGGALSGLGDAAKESAMNLGGGGGGGGGSLMDRLGSGLSSVGSFAAKNPTAVGMGLQGLGAMQSAGSENALRNAQAAQLQAQTQAQEEENAAKKQRAAAMEPLLRALMGGSGIKVAPNPYL